MNQAKIRLSQKEAELVLNAEWILTKNEIIKKAKHLLELLLEEQKNFLLTSSISLPKNVLNISPKISRGENYNGLPYLVLDHPRYFDKENVFAIRTMFWWGNFFSITLHLSGEYKRLSEQKMIAAFQQLKENEFYCCTGDEQWEHHFEKDNYTLVNELNEHDFKKIIIENSFIKIATKIGVEQWNNAEEMLLHYFMQIIKILAD